MWFLKKDLVGVVALWGVPETHAVGFVVTCDDHSKVILSPALFTMDEPKAGQQLRFTVDGTTFVRDARLVFSERDAAWRASAAVGVEDELLLALKSGRAMTYDFAPPLRDGDAFTVSLKGSSVALADVLSAC